MVGLPWFEPVGTLVPKVDVARAFVAVIVVGLAVLFAEAFLCLVGCDGSSLFGLFIRLGS